MNTIPASKQRPGNRPQHHNPVTFLMATTYVTHSFASDIEFTH